MLVHNRHVALSSCTFNLSLLSKTKTWKIWKRVLMMKKSLNFTDNQIPEKQNKKQSYDRHKYLCNKITFCALFCALFLQFLCTVFGIHFFSEKSFSPVEIKCLGKMSTLLRKYISIGKPFNWVKVFCLECCNDSRMWDLFKSN